jgi:hypothetical protein
MSDRAGVRLRCLPDGAFQPALALGWKNRLLELDVTGIELPQKALLEIECGSVLYLGELLRNDGSIASVLIEHSVDCAKLKPIQQTWG